MGGGRWEGFFVLGIPGWDSCQSSMAPSTWKRLKMSPRMGGGKGEEEEGED